MNERIKELAEQAGFQYIKDEGIGWAGNYNASLPKFALLLMREIAMVQITHQTTMDLENKKMDNPARELNYAVIKHFGVEE
jgi:hypothetical protein